MLLLALLDRDGQEIPAGLAQLYPSFSSTSMRRLWILNDLYVAPEALSGELVGPQADQYSLATIAYFLLSGCHPYVAKSQREMFSQLLSQPPIPLNEIAPHCLAVDYLAVPLSFLFADWKSAR